MKRYKLKFTNLRVLIDIALGYVPEDKDKQKKEIINRLFQHVYHPMEVCINQIENCLRNTTNYDQAYQTAYNILMPKRSSIYEDEVLNIQ